MFGIYSIKTSIHSNFSVCSRRKREPSSTEEIFTIIMTYPICKSGRSISHSDLKLSKCMRWAYVARRAGLLLDVFNLVLTDILTLKLRRLTQATSRNQTHHACQHAARYSICKNLFFGASFVYYFRTDGAHCENAVRMASAKAKSNHNFITLLSNMAIFYTLTTPLLLVEWWLRLRVSASIE